MLFNNGGTTWTAQASGTTNDLRWLWADTPPTGYTGDVYVVGDAGTIQHWNGTRNGPPCWSGVNTTTLLPASTVYHLHRCISSGTTALSWLVRSSPVLLLLVSGCHDGPSAPAQAKTVALSSRRPTPNAARLSHWLRHADLACCRPTASSGLRRPPRSPSSSRRGSSCGSSTRAASRYPPQSATRRSPRSFT